MSKSRILIVDDVKKNIQVLANTLSEIYDIEYATNGNDAIEWVKSEHFDLVLLDIMMPEIDGYQVCEMIRADKNLDDLPIIFLTAKSDSESIIKGFDMGAQDYVLKPFNPKELKARVRTHIDLKHSKEKVKDVNKWLEKQVEMKTHELNSAYKDLELLDIAKNEFIALLSHELRTPLNGIKGFAELLENQVKSDKLLGYIKLINQSSDRLIKFSQIAILISSIKAKTYRLRPENVGLQNFIREICGRFHFFLQKKSVEIIINGNEQNINVIGDLHLLKEAFGQVIENAVNHSPENSVINIDITNYEKNILLIIKDCGNGFSEKALKNIFQLFAVGQLHVDNKVGLGLHLAKLIMDLHKGDIEIGNSENGAFVKMIFPKKPIG